MDDAHRLGEAKTGAAIGRAEKLEDARGRYVAFAKATFPRDLSLDGVRVVVDAAHGAAYRVAPLVFQELGAKVFALGVKPNGTNINREVGALHPEHAREEVRKRGAHIGIALDGDADRVIVIDEKGEVVDGDAVMAMCALRMLRDKELRQNTVVATVMSNLGLERALAAQGARLLRTPVGDRYVVEAMRSGGYNLGGEQSGHLVFLDHASTGDGIIGGLQVLALMMRTGRPALRAGAHRHAARAPGAGERDPARAAAPRPDGPPRPRPGAGGGGAGPRGPRARALERHRAQAAHHAGGARRGAHPGLREGARGRGPQGRARRADRASGPARPLGAPRAVSRRTP